MKNRLAERQKSLNIIALYKLGKLSERFIFVYDDDPQSISALLKTFRKFADDLEINFTSQDRKCLIRKLAKLTEQT